MFLTLMGPYSNPSISQLASYLQLQSFSADNTLNNLHAPWAEFARLSLRYLLLRIPCKRYPKGLFNVHSGAGIFPAEDEDYTNLQKALEKLKLNDASLVYEPERSIALGFGYRCGFLGLLHLEIVQERLEREFNLNLVITSPSVEVKLKLTNGEEKLIDNPADFPSAQYIEKCYEPFINALIIVPTDYLGNIISLCIDRRGTQTSLTYLDDTQLQNKFHT